MKKVALLLMAFVAITFGNWTFDWVGDPGYEWNGLEPDYFDGNGLFTFRIKVLCAEMPEVVFVHIDADADGYFSAREAHAMKIESKVADGYVFAAKLPLYKPYSTRPIGYFFSAQIGNRTKTSPLSLGPFFESRVSFRMIGDTLWEHDTPVMPLEVIVNSPNNRFLFVNTGDMPLTFGLMIVPEPNNLLQPIKTENELNTDKYLLSAMFFHVQQKQPAPNQFNTRSWEDVLSFEPKFASTDVFGFSQHSFGEKLMPGDTTALWFNFVAPSATSIQGSQQAQSILISVFAISAQ